MTHVKILAVATLAASVFAISPSIAQQRGHAMGGATAAPAPRAGANVSAGANVRTPRMNTAAAAGTLGNARGTGMRWNGNSGNWNGGRVAANTWNGNGNWDGRNWSDRRFHRGPGFAFGFGVGPGYGGPYYDDYAYGRYPYDDSYAYYNDPYYSDTFAYDTGPVGVAVETAPAVGVAVNGGADPAYCARRYRSYDPASGTFLGYDGMRHPCP